METSMLLARIIGPVMFIVSLAILFRPERMKAVALEVSGNPALLFIIGMMRLVFGFLIIYFHNFWIQSWEVIITLFGWLAAISGTLVLLFPENIAGLMKSVAKKKGFFSVAGVIIFLVGAYLAYVGYLAG